MSQEFVQQSSQHQERQLSEGIDKLLESTLGGDELGMVGTDDLFTSLAEEEKSSSDAGVQVIPADALLPSAQRPPEPPETGVTAQIVLIVTSLGSFRRQFFNSKRAQHFLDCKGLVYHLIDTNRDVSEGIDLMDQELLKEWDEKGLLAKPDTKNKLLSVPQVLIDGVFIGDAAELQDMEEDGDLDWVTARAACPSCLNEKDPGDVECPNCGSSFFDLIPDEIVENHRVQRFCRGQQYEKEEPLTRHLTYKDAIAIIEHEAKEEEHETLTYESLFGEAPPPE